MTENIVWLYRGRHLLIAQTTALATDDEQTAVFGGFNLGLHVGDKAALVLARRADLLKRINQALAPEQKHIDGLYWLNQVHGNQVHVWDDVGAMSLVSADAHISLCGNVGLAIMTADCVPIVIFDDGDDNPAMACIHAGWQGLVKGVIAQTVRAMPTPKGVYRAYLGVCISGAAYEMGQDLAMDIVRQCHQQALTTLDQDALTQAVLLPSTQPDKCQLDVVRLTRLQLMALGVEPMFDDVPCSYQGAKLGQYYSHRYATHQSWQSTGRMAMVVARF